jgi:glyoxylase-like metal-dependent hydrolase (beta-lactamase superfamily II)
MSQINNQDTDLTYQILTSKRPGLSRGLPPGKEDLAWVANSATLISGQRDAVLVDAFLTSEQAKTLADWVAASGKNLTAIYVTLGHGDHFFGLVPLLERFPRARAIAIPKIVEAMEQQLSPAWFDNFWRKLFPDYRPHAEV